MSCQTHSFPGVVLRDTLHLEQNCSGFDLGNKEFGAAFAATHLNILGFAGNRCMRKDSYPDLAATLNVSGHSLSGRFNLSGSNSFLALRLKSIVSKSNVLSGSSYSPNPAFSDLPVLLSLWQ